MIEEKVGFINRDERNPVQFSFEGVLNWKAGMPE